MIVFFFFFFFFNDTATTEIYTLSLHDALPIWTPSSPPASRTVLWPETRASPAYGQTPRSEEHTSNSSHGYISYAVFCLKKKKKPYAAFVHKNKNKQHMHTNNL